MFFFVVVLLFILSIIVIINHFWQKRQRVKRRQLQIRQLRQWASEHEALDPVLQQWLQRLTAAEAETLYTLLTGFCASLNWELSWLFAPQIQKAPELKRALEESVSAYARAILLSLQMEADVAAYQTYVAFAKKPGARKQRPLVEQLYQRLDQVEPAPVAKRFFGRMSRKKLTPKQQVTAIQAAFDKHPAQTMQLLKEVLAGDAAAVVEQVRHDLAPSSLTLAAGVAA